MERHNKEKIIAIEIYTDGSTKKTGKLSFGGWAFIAVQDGKILYENSGNQYGTTNQRMELTAIKEALLFIQQKRRPEERVVIYSDSAYAINCYLQQWYINWQQNGWINAKKQEVSNKDLWFDIIPFFENFWYSFKKVPAHAGNFWNEKCDELAQREASLLKTNWRGLENE